MGKIKEFVLSFTYKGKKDKEFRDYMELRAQYINMDKIQLDFEYARLKSEYEHKKNVLTFFTIAIAISMIMGVWNEFFDFMKKVLTYSTVDSQVNSDVVKISFFISVTILLFTITIILYIIYLNGKQIKIMREKIILIEQIKKACNLQCINLLNEKVDK